jgi:hypothetical protein
MFRSEPSGPPTSGRRYPPGPPPFTKITCLVLTSQGPGPLRPSAGSHCMQMHLEFRWKIYNHCRVHLSSDPSGGQAFRGAASRQVVVVSCRCLPLTAGQVLATRLHAIAPYPERGAFVFLVRSPAVNGRPVVPTPTMAFEAAAFAGPLARNRCVPLS